MDLNNFKNKRLGIYLILVGVLTFSFSYSKFTRSSSSLFAQSDGSTGNGPEAIDKGNIGNQINKERHGSIDHNEVTTASSKNKRNSHSRSNSTSKKTYKNLNHSDSK